MLFSVKINHDKYGSMCNVRRLYDLDDSVDVPRCINKSFVVRVHRNDGLKINNTVNTNGILLEVYDPLRIDDVRVYRASAKATDRTCALKQQHNLLTSSWTHGFGIDESLLSHKIRGEHGSWTSICIPLLSAIISNAIAGILAKWVDRIRAVPTTVKNVKTVKKWYIVMGGTSLSTYIFLGTRTRTSSDVDVSSSSSSYEQAPSHPEDRIVYGQYDIAYRYEVIHNSRVSARSSKLIDTSLIVSGMKSGLKPVESDAERSLVDDSIDLVRGALVVSGISNMFMMKLENIESIQATRNEHVCECCGALQATKPILCEHCMNQIMCSACASKEAFARHEPLSCMSHKWKIEVPVM